MSLSAERFPEFFRQVYGQDPFPWQRRLAMTVADESWPSVIGLPTACGKTACLDIAVFALACQASRPIAERTAPRRIFFVVDRRLIVDAAFTRMRRLAVALHEARDGVLLEVADQLRALGGEPVPLVCAELRGGIYRDDAWARSPAQPTILASTVDQIGSRLLFRGYGLRRGSLWPVHAGLACNDALILLDEAHCSVPFAETLTAVSRFRTLSHAQLQNPFRVVEMTATPASKAAAFVLDDSDRAHPQLSARLSCAKSTELVVSDGGKGDRAAAALATKLAEHARKLVQGGCRVVAVMVNRVATARRVAELLESDPESETVIFTGRIRPWERDRRLNRWAEMLAANADRPRPGKPIFVVATQCLEVGADFDFDGLVTECSSLDSLCQRFGRLNRLGLRQEAPAAIVIRSDQAEASDDDPIYGGALAGTWQWLLQQAQGQPVNMGVNALAVAVASSSSTEIASLRSPRASAPALLPSHLDALVQTSPAPLPSPDPALFLHGPKSGPADVQVLFRADLVEGRQESWIDAVSICPPSAPEAIPAALGTLRRWMCPAEGQRAALTTDSDLEGSVQTEDEGPGNKNRSVVLWRGLVDSMLIDDPGLVRPGDTVVIPACSPGLEDLGQFDSQQTDIGDAVYADVRRRIVLRLHPALLPSPRAEAPAEDPLRRLSELVETVATGDEDAWAALVEDEQGLRDLLTVLADKSDDFPDWWRLLARELGNATLRERRRNPPLRHPTGGIVLYGSLPPVMLEPAEALVQARTHFSDEDENSCRTSGVSLEAHSAHVEAKARRFARLAGLPETLCDDLAKAGAWHDLGKADPRFQLMLYRGDAARAEAGPMLAKSSGPPLTPGSYATIRSRSGYPVGGRHELLSVRLVESGRTSLEATAADAELVLHLIGSHHGWCRPLAPVIDDPQPVSVDYTLDGNRLQASSATGLEHISSGMPERFWRLVRRYGWWGLAWIEAVLRLADHRASEDEQQGIHNA